MEKGKTFKMRTDEQFLADIDDWRATQRPVPSRAEAIRVLCYAGMATKTPKKRKT